MPKEAAEMESGFIRALCMATVVIVSGCVSSEKVLDLGRRSSIHHIAIRAVEPPPLTVPTAFAKSLKTAGEFGELRELGFLIGAVVIATPASEDTREEVEQYEAYARALEASKSWSPTRILARGAAAVIKERGTYRTELVSPVLRLYSGEKRGRFDTYGPVRGWYNSDDSRLGSVATEADAVLEIGLLHFEFFEYPENTRPTFIVQVLARLVDARSGKVLGRVRKADHGLVPGMHALFADDANVFREIFENMTAPLVRQTLTAMGLL